MPKKPLVSLIIPTFNRAHLICETLDSILAQTYIKWECLVIDDGSTDETETILQRYINKDNRFQYHKRPDIHLSGGNGARNYGFLKSKGELVNWFDSDDLMTLNFLELKVKTLQLNKVDFVISKTKYFNRKNRSFSHYNFKEDEVSFEKFATTPMNWSTPDTMVKRTIVDTISYNENLKAGQEYNFICKLLLKTTSMAIVDEFLTLRRAHEVSISSSRVNNKQYYLKSKFYAYWVTYKDLNEIAKSKKFNTYSLLKCVLCFLNSGNTITLPPTFIRELYRVFKYRVLAFYLASFSNRIMGKYHFFYNLLK